jgi:hypothetical protein
LPDTGAVVVVVVAGMPADGLLPESEVEDTVDESPHGVAVAAVADFQHARFAPSAAESLGNRLRQ